MIPYCPGAPSVVSPPLFPNGGFHSDLGSWPYRISWQA
ncbi:unnamed protein product, partial [Staurois parvus]